MTAKLANARKPESEPPFQTLSDVFHYELRKRSTYDGIAQAALNGDRKALADFAGAAVVALEDDSAEFASCAREWLIGILSRIQSGTEPNEAFGWKKKKRGRPGARTNFSNLMRQYLIGQSVAGILANDKEMSEAVAGILAKDKVMSEASAFRIVSKELNASVSLVSHCWSRWQGLEKTPW